MHIVLDMDDTLVTCTDGTPSNLPIVNLGVIEGALHSVYVRPYAHEFLTFCKQNFDSVYLCSFSIRERVQRCLSSTGLKQYFNGWYGREDLESGNVKGPVLNDFFLLDDAPWNSWLVPLKLTFFGFRPKVYNFEHVFRYHISVEPFSGMETDIELQRLVGVLTDRLQGKV